MRSLKKVKVLQMSAKHGLYIVPFVDRICADANGEIVIFRLKMAEKTVHLGD